MTLFERIINREIPASIVYEDEHAVAFRDIHPQAPVHLLVVPRRVLERLSDARDTDDDTLLLGHCMQAARRAAAEAGLDSYRIVINCGEDAGQTVFHLHLHVLGGRSMGWPPG